MKKTIFYFLCLLGLFSVLLFSCKDKDDKEDEPAPIEYYVKYEFQFGSFGSFGNHVKTAHVSVATEDGNRGFNVPASSTMWEGVFGPFKECKTLMIEAQPDGFNSSLHMHGRISISKNGGPFVLKIDHEQDLNSIFFRMIYNVTEKDLQ